MTTIVFKARTPRECLVRSYGNNLLPLHIDRRGSAYYRKAWRNTRSRLLTVYGEKVFFSTYIASNIPYVAYRPLYVTLVVTFFRDWCSNLYAIRRNRLEPEKACSPSNRNRADSTREILYVPPTFSHFLRQNILCGFIIVSSFSPFI